MTPFYAQSHQQSQADIDAQNRRAFLDEQLKLCGQWQACIMNCLGIWSRNGPSVGLRDQLMEARAKAEECMTAIVSMDAPRLTAPAKNRYS